jgi:hypothetical protein
LLRLSCDLVEQVAGHVFLSYVREDSSDVAKLHKTLEAAGIRVWRDTADLWPGQDWRTEIRRAITDNALVFIACFSTRSVARQKTYQNEELTLAIDQLRMRPPNQRMDGRFRGALTEAIQGVIENAIREGIITPEQGREILRRREVAFEPNAKSARPGKPGTLR